jgi:hypothetical protein
MKHIYGPSILICLLTLATSASADTLRVPGDYATITAALAAASDGDTIRVASGNHPGALVDKRVHIRGEGRATINDGPTHGSGLRQGFRLIAGSDGATISHLRFAGFDSITGGAALAIMNGAAINNVTVAHCTFIDTIQAISDWVGDGWEIIHNEIIGLRTRCGGGIGILVADFTGTGGATNNLISHNKVVGTLNVPESDCGGYNGSGIVLFSDYRFGRSGGPITDNRVIQNKVGMSANDPGDTGVDIVAFELTDTRDSTAVLPYPVVKDNAIGFNDWRKTALQEALTPTDLENHNRISRNLGNNRGQGDQDHPSVFGPGGN